MSKPREPEPIGAVAATFIRMKVARGQWWGPTIRNGNDAIWSFCASLPKLVAIDVRRVRREHVQAWLDTDPSHSPGYKQVRLSPVRGMFRWLHQEGRIGLDPTVGVYVDSNGVEPLPRAFTDDDVDVLFDIARRDPRELVCVSLCWNEGLRRIEVARALIEDLDFRTRTLRVRGKRHRGKVSRTAAVSPATIHALLNYLAAEPARSGALIRSRVRPGMAVHAKTIGNIVDRAIRDAGLKWFPWDGRSSHAGRHTAATQSLEAGARPEHMKRHFGWETDAMIRRYTMNAGLDLHEIHRLRDVRREQLGLPVAAAVAGEAAEAEAS